MARSLIAASLLMLPLFSFANSTVPLSGDFRVTEQGAASYTLPIAIPKARGGLQAQMAIQYSSGGQNGPMGLGMALSAGSAISRCPQTIVQDGAVRGIELSESDRFCLDGQRLILATGTYGAAGSTYRKEIDDYSVITALGQAPAGGPLAFQVETKSGDTHYYGNVYSVLPTINLRDVQANNDASDAALVIANRSGSNIALSWAIKGTVDPVGNYISYQYGQDTVKGEQWLKSMASGGHLGESQPPYVEARVSYDANPRPRYGFVAGVPYSQTKLVSAIAVYQDGELASHYVLDYRKSQVIEEQVYLNSVMRCVSVDTSDCSEPVYFSWLRPDQLTVSGKESIVDPETGKTLFVDVPIQEFSPFATPTETALPIDNRSTAQAFDMTGDGRDDLVFVKNGQWNIASFDGSFSQVLTSKGVSRAQYAMSINYDGDGQRDLLVSDASSGNWFVLSFKPSVVQDTFCEPMYGGGEKCENVPRDVAYTLTDIGLTSEGYQDNAMVADVNGDGLEDIVYVKDKKLEWYRNQGGSFEVGATLYSFSTGFQSSYGDPLLSQRSANLKTSAAFDVNGDGRTDLLLKITTHEGSCSKPLIDNPTDCTDVGEIWTMQTDESWKLFVAQGNVNTPSYAVRQSLGYGDTDVVRTADLNADGISDLMFFINGKWISSLGNGYGFEAPKDTGLTATESEAQKSQFLDLNGDGRSDMLKASGSNAFYIMMSLPLDSSKSMMWLSRGMLGIDTTRTLQFVDTQGRGQIDLYSANNNHWYKHASRQDEFENLIDRITEGYGVTTTIQYSRLTRKKYGMNTGEPDVYTTQVSTAEASEDNFSFLMPLVVVKEAHIEATESSTLGTAYEYGGLAFNRLGRGVLGFQVLKSRDLQSGVVTETQFHQVFPFIGMPKSSTQYVDNKTVNYTTAEYAAVETIPGAKAVFARRTWNKSYQIGSDNQHYPLTQIYTENSVVDEWGNIEDLLVETTNLATGVMESRVRAQNIYQGNGGGAQKGRLSSASLTKTRFGQRENTESITRNTSFTYYSNGMLHTSVLSPADSRYKTTTTNEYDVWGNPTKISVTAATKADGSALETRTKHYVYDARGRYLASERNGLDEQISYTYNGMSPDLVTGRITESRATDPNDFWVDKFRDVWGRETGSAGKDGLTTQTGWALCSANSDCDEFPSAILVATKTASAKPTEQVFYDRFGRVLGSRHQGFASNSWVYKKTEYDAKGRPFKHFEPTYSGVSTINATIVEYDDFDRITQQTAPNGGVSNTYYYGHRTRAVDHYGNFTDYLNAATGEKYQVTDTYGSRLEYLYDSYGNLLKVWAQAASGPEVVRTATEHDLYGRKLATIDLDKGRWTYTYNAFGELLTQTNANGDQVSFGYDSLGRKTSRLEPEGLSCWQYGNTSTGDVGRLLSERTYSNLAADCADANPTTEKTFGYDPLGPLISTDYQFGSTSFRVEQSYDAYSRPDVMTYPGGSVKIKHAYTATGYLEERTNATTGALYQRILTMDARGNPEEVVYGNDTTESRIYKPDTGWLESITLQKATLLHKLEYTFDKKGNLDFRNHELSVAQANWSEDYLYDDLYRLTDRVISVSVDGLGTLPAAFKTDQQFQYDDWGNIKYKSGTGFYDYDETTNPYRLLNICAEGACVTPTITPASFGCPAGYSYNAGAANCEKAESKSATVQYEYYCPVGYSLNAGTGNCDKLETTAASVSYSYTCATGYSYNSSAARCEKAETKAATATTTPTCSSGYSYNSGTGDCRKTESQAATPNYSYSCPSGYSYNSSSGDCRKSESASATVSYTYSCGSGWTLSGTSCTKTESQAASSSTTYSCPTGYSYSASAGYCRKFSIIQATKWPTGPNIDYCEGLEPLGDGLFMYECWLKASATSQTSYSCTAGWTLSGSSCTRTLNQSATQHTQYSCSAGWTLSGTTCSRTLIASATQNTTYSCSSGWSLSGSTCSRVLTQAAGSSTTYSCDSGWSLSGTSCNRLLTANATQNSHFSCAAGWTLSANNCTRTLTEPQIADPVEQCPAGYSYSVGAGNCQKVESQAASSSVDYSCPAGYTLSGQSCSKFESKAANQATVLVCPTGYTWDATAGYCRKFQIINDTNWPSGPNIDYCEGLEPLGDGWYKYECWLKADRISESTYSCDAGWNLSDQTCSRTLTQTASSNTVYSCAAGWTLNGSSCNRTLTAAATIYQCDAGWTLNGSNCGRTLTAAASFSCPAGTTQVGSECHRYPSAQYDFAYDDQGNVLNDGDRTFEYTSYDLVSRITKGSEYSEFKYDAGRARYSRTDSKQENGYTAIYQTTYVAGIYEKVERTGGGKADLTEHKFYVGNAVITERSTGINDIFYLHKDHQGSTTTVTDAQGTAVQQFVYDPWGKQTHAFVASKLNDVISPTFTRGYTGHEHLAHVDIIHMNGRIYDGNIARFVQADPFIQSPSDFQNYNRYAYVNNNPMSYTDPSGYFLEKLHRLAGKWDGREWSHKNVFNKNPALADKVQNALGNLPGWWGPAMAAAFAFDRVYYSSGNLRAATINGGIAFVGTYLSQETGGQSSGAPDPLVNAFGDNGPVSEGTDNPINRIFHFLQALNQEMAAEEAAKRADAQVVASTIGQSVSVQTGGKFVNGGMYRFIYGRTSFINVTIDFVQPGWAFNTPWGEVQLIPETNLVLDVGYAKSDMNGDRFAEHKAIFYTVNEGDMKGFDIGVGVELGNGNAQNFYGPGFQMNVGYGGNLMGRAKGTPIDLNTTNPNSLFIQHAANMTISADFGFGGGVHWGRVRTESLLSWE